LYDYSAASFFGKKMSGTVYVASMNMRGKHAVHPEGSIKVNVTSAQATASKNRRDFSPMTPVPGGFKGFLCYENYWQSLKVYEHVPHEVTSEWWKRQEEPHRRYPGSKGKTVLGAKRGHDETTLLDYVESRKKVYVPEYSNLIEGREMLQFYKDQIDQGRDVTIFDFDGPRTPEGDVLCLELTEDLLKEKINDTRHPFGHGYVVASMIAGIPIEKYCI
jgi:hypothetical protein